MQIPMSSLLKGEPFNGHIVAKVIQSNAKDYNEGDIVVGMLPWKKKTLYQQSISIKYLQQMPLIFKRTRNARANCLSWPFRHWTA